MTKVSLITPTFNRQGFLPLLQKCFEAQSYPDLEWLILDDSEQPDPVLSHTTAKNIRYVHVPDRLSIGAKRNRLIEMAQGEMIAHFDDDDYYGPNYIQTAVKALEDTSADLALLDAFMVGHPETDSFGYYLTQVKTGIAYNFSDGKVNVLQLEKLSLPLVHFCFGFSYIYRRDLWKRNPFSDQNAFEDRKFTRAAIDIGKVIFYRDANINVIHTVHGKSTSNSFPQYLIPPFLIAKADAAAYNHMRQLKQVIEGHKAIT